MINKVLFLFFIFVLFEQNIKAKTEVQFFKGVAKKDNKVVYVENHKMIFENQKLVKVITDYVDSKGKKLAMLKSDFSELVELPQHEMNDYIQKMSYGLSFKGKKIILFKKDGLSEIVDKDLIVKIKNSDKEKKKTKTLSIPYLQDLSKVHQISLKEKNQKGIYVSGQGLHYLITHHMEDVIKLKKLDLHFIIPGKLDVYKFNLIVKKVGPKKVDFELVVHNWFLKLFAPKFQMTYDRELKRLLHYRGLSNIFDSSGDFIKVDISYSYKNE